MGIYDEWTPAFAKPNRKRKKVDKNFTKDVVESILERDDFKCIKCHRSTMIESVPHHVIFKSQGGLGIKRNGVTVCRYCHDWAHGKRPGSHGELPREGREWFEMWVDENLDENGDRIR